jgi:hypothetical protein
MSAVAVDPFTLELDAARQFDFLLGEWDCTWSDAEGPHLGSNSVYLDLGGAVVVESFDGRPSLDFQGLSYSVYDRDAQCWKQTWVDSDGSYHALVGRFEDGVMDLRRQGELGLYRLLWENIERDSLDWSRQRSDDGGEAWTTLWEIGYRRVL